MGDREKLDRFRELQCALERNVVDPAACARPESNGCIIDYARELNPSQYVAATTADGPLLILAGAGSGKTRTLTYRVAYLLEKGAEPNRILLLTFTRKASEEMVARCSRLLGKRYRTRDVFGGTFHSFANSMLRRFGDLAGVAPNFTVLDATDSADALDMCARNLGLKNKRTDAGKFPAKAKVQAIYSMARNWDISLGKALHTWSETLYETFLDDFEELIRQYEEYKRDNKVFDFDDLMTVFRDRLRDNGEFRRRISGLVDYLMVDEYQDTNVVQAEIVNLLGRGHRNVMAVGDDSQSIYAFRGANVANIFTFVETYPECCVVKLERNYRSVAPILNLANQVTDNARMCFRKKLYSEEESRDKPMVVACLNPENEAAYIRQTVASLMVQGVPPGEIAVICRSAYHSNTIQLELLRHRINFVLRGGQRFMERKNVKDLIAHLKLMVNPLEEVAWHRVLELLPNIGRATAGKVVKSIKDREGRIDFSEFRKAKSYGGLRGLQQLLAEQPQTPARAAEKVIAYYRQLLWEGGAESKEVDRKSAEQRILARMAENYTSLEKFLTDLTLDPPDPSDQRQDKIVVSTVHSAKGLEFDHVIIPHMLDGLFPSEKALGTLESEEEERRIFYVAATRAKKRLILTYPREKKTQGGERDARSRFIDELDPSSFEAKRTFKQR
jgi:DNA helicase-2/ATP-dependent DNA helicase PcrA